MSIWSQENCLVTNYGNEALTLVSAQGGQMIFDSVWTCGIRVDANFLAALTDLPQKNQQMLLSKVKTIDESTKSATLGYTINVSVTNDNLETEYNIEMLGVYFKLKGFNNDEPFLYMVLLVDEGTADVMKTISRVTYKYSIYLYHTNKANLSINLVNTDFVTVETFNETVNGMKKDLNKIMYFSYTTMDSIDDNDFLHLTTTKSDTAPFVAPVDDEAPILILYGYDGMLPNDFNDNALGIYIDDVGPYEIYYYNRKADTQHVFMNEPLLCVYDPTLSKFVALNYFDDTEYLKIEPVAYTNFNNLPLLSGIYKLSGTAKNAPVELTSSDSWTATITKTGTALFLVAQNTADGNIYRRTLNTNLTSWSAASEWTLIGGGNGGGLLNATAVFTNTTTSSADTTAYHLKITLEEEKELEKGDLFSVTVSNLSTSNSNCYLFNSDLFSGNKQIYQSDGVSSIPATQVPEHFILKYTGSKFIMVSPLTTPIIKMSTSSPVDGVDTATKGTLWIKYYNIDD